MNEFTVLVTLQAPAGWDTDDVKDTVFTQLELEPGIKVRTVEIAP